MTNKCNDTDLEFYIKECSDIMGISSKIESKNDPKAILSYVFSQLVNFKKLNPWKIKFDLNFWFNLK